MQNSLFQLVICTCLCLWSEHREGKHGDSLLFFIFSDSENSLLRYLSDDKILVIQEEPETQRECKRDTGRRSRKKGKNPSSPSYPISPSLLTSTVRLDSSQSELLSFPLPESNTVPLYHVSALTLTLTCWSPQTELACVKWMSPTGHGHFIRTH